LKGGGGEGRIVTGGSYFSFRLPFRDEMFPTAEESSAAPSFVSFAGSESSERSDVEDMVGDVSEGAGPVAWEEVGEADGEALLATTLNVVDENVR
jgi:hypothetical protein